MTSSKIGPDEDPNEALGETLVAAALVKRLAIFVMMLLLEAIAPVLNLRLNSEAMSESVDSGGSKESKDINLTVSLE